jgi:SAM-dependent methyltransferase
MAPEWNHNLHHHGLLLAAVPSDCRRALDVGCGEGALVRRLAAHVDSVTGIDADSKVIARARDLSGTSTNVGFVHGDFLLQPLPPSYDLICAVASLHHMDFSSALTRMAELLRPGGVLAVVGVARARAPRDFAFAALGFVAHRLHRVGHVWREVGAPVADPTMTYGQVRRAVRDLLPGARFRRHALFRYSVIWRKPD